VPCCLTEFMADQGRKVTYASILSRRLVCSDRLSQISQATAHRMIQHALRTIN
jgi:hypothetical protein